MKFFAQKSRQEMLQRVANATSPKKIVFAAVVDAFKIFEALRFGGIGVRDWTKQPQRKFRKTEKSNKTSFKQVSWRQQHSRLVSYFEECLVWCRSTSLGNINLRRMTSPKITQCTDITRCISQYHNASFDCVTQHIWRHTTLNCFTQHIWSHTT